MNRHPRADRSTSPRTARKTTSGDSSDPAVTTAASSQPDTASAGHRPAAAAAAATTPPPRPQHAARRVQRHRVHRQTPRQPGEELPHPASRRAEPAQPVPHRVLRHSRGRRDRPEPLTPGRPREHLPDHPRRVAPAHQQPRREQNMRDPARGAPRPPRLHAHRNPAPPEHPPTDRVTVPAQPPAAPGTRKKAVTEHLLDDGRAVAYREQWCLRAPSRPSPRLRQKDSGEGRPITDTLTVSSHPTPPQPEPPRKPRSPAKTQPAH